jgi:hypothetical protein
MANGGESLLSKIVVGVVVTVVGGLILAFLLGWLDLDGDGRGGSPSPIIRPTPSPTGAGATPSPTPATAKPSITPAPSGCILTITNPFARINEEPRHDSVEAGDVPPGEYVPSDSTISNWAGKDERWFEITAEGRTGWIVDNGILIESKSADCP